MQAEKNSTYRDFFKEKKNDEKPVKFPQPRTDINP